MEKGNRVVLRCQEDAVVSIWIDEIRRVHLSWRRPRHPSRRTSRVIVKRILRKYGYPPDKQEKATRTVLPSVPI